MTDDELILGYWEGDEFGRLTIIECLDSDDLPLSEMLGKLYSRNIVVKGVSGEGLMPCQPKSWHFKSLAEVRAWFTFYGYVEAHLVLNDIIPDDPLSTH